MRDIGGKTVLGAVVAVAVIASAMGGVSGAAVVRGAATRGVTDTTIRVAGLGTMSSQRLTTYKGMEVGAQAYFAKVNAAGGVNGRKIQYVDTFDDEDNNDKNAEQARRIASEDIFAVVPAITNFFGGAEILQDANIPYFGWGFHQAFCKNKWGFGFNGCNVEDNPEKPNVGWPGLIQEAFPKVETIAFQAEDSDAGRRILPQYEAGAEKLDLEVLYTDASMPFGGGADLTPYVQKVIDADPDAIFVVLTAPVAIRFTQQLHQSGYDGVVSMPTAYDPRVKGSDGLQDSYHYVTFANLSSGYPAIEELIADVAAYAGPDQIVNQPVASGYFSAMLFTQILEAVGKNLTSNRFLKVANKTTFDADGAVAKYSYPNGHKRSRPCGSLAYLNNKEFTSKVDLYCSDGTDPLKVPKGF